MDKPVVHLREVSSMLPVQVGATAYIKCIDHTSPHVTNWPQGEGWVQTSEIIKINDDGFETLNTIYKKHPDLYVG